jgi:hypothetical protein
VVDELIEQIVSAQDEKTLTTRTRALDRILSWNSYVIPHWHLSADRVLYWDKFSYPAVSPKTGALLSTWWFDAEKAARLAAGWWRQETDGERPVAAGPRTPLLGPAIGLAVAVGLIGYVALRRFRRPRGL